VWKITGGEERLERLSQLGTRPWNDAQLDLAEYDHVWTVVFAFFRDCEGLRYKRFSFVPVC
jgi:hypothetical protein